MSDKVSVIIPIYNTKKYLNRCVESVIGQTYKNIEIILIDDGSSDGSEKICDEITSYEPRARVLHKNNGGLSDARNAGMQIATGEYLVFCDSDDWMEPEIINRAISEIKGTDAQMVIWGYSADVVDQSDNLISSTQCAVEATIEVGDTRFLSDRNIQGLLGYAWNKLYKKRILANNKLQFEKNVSLVEDVIFNSQTIVCCNKIRLIDSIGTHYVQRNIITLGNSYYYNYCELIMRAVEAKMTIMCHFCCVPEDINSIIAKYITTALKFGVLNITRDSSIGKAEKRNRLKRLLKDNTLNDLINMAQGLSLKDKLFLALLKFKATEIIIFLTK